MPEGIEATDDTHKTENDTEHQAPMTCYEKLSLFTQSLIFIAAAVYSFFAWGQWREIRRQGNIANKTLLLTQRPKLRIRNVGITPIPTLDNPSHPRLRRQPVTVEFSIVNIGATIAKIRESHCSVFWTSNPLPMQLPYKDHTPNNIANREKLDSGECHWVSFKGENLEEEKREGSVRDYYTALYVMGYIDYIDELHLTRRTAFCRRLARTPEGSRYFAVEENPDYEHED